MAAPLQNANFENLFLMLERVQILTLSQIFMIIHTTSNGGDYRGHLKMGRFLTLRVMGGPRNNVNVGKKYFMLESVEI